ncbi:VanZ family protein [Cohnella sp. AR92]|uniref:VanZ family protein n=1 Tax=Cohnella sp. AR92 TaxID=648716 RepID=UPI000F8F026B|nr:VanZ family protein [Cohnella sp. AR92]RUS48923.1 VanZ family protein [Cohnella sp. AR92]
MKKQAVTGLMYAVFAVYIAFLIKIILLKTGSLADIVQGRSGGYRSYNLLPFQIFVDYGTYLKSANWLRAFSNIAGNAAIFVPFGMLMPALFPNVRARPARLAFLALAVSILFESLQFALSLGSADIDDVLLNMLGALCGFVIYRWIARYANQNSLQTQGLVLALIAVGSIPALWIAREEFGDMLGLTKHEIVYEGMEFIPRREADAEGTLIRLTGDRAEYYLGWATGDRTKDEWLEKRQSALARSTKIYRSTIIGGKQRTTIRYEKLTSEQYGGIPERAGIRLWLNPQSNVPEVILITDPLPRSGDAEDAIQISSPTGQSESPRPDKKNSEENGKEASPATAPEEISGSILDLDGNRITLNLSMDQELDGGSAVSVMGLGDNAVKVKVMISEGTKYTLRVVKGGGKSYKDRPATREMLAADQTVQLTGKHIRQDFLAESIFIYKFE